MIRSLLSALVLVVVVALPAAAQTETTEPPATTTATEAGEDQGAPRDADPSEVGEPDQAPDSGDASTTTQTFDGLPVPGWDIAPQATVEEGVMVLGEGAAAFYPAESNELTATWRISYTGTGEILFTYAASESGGYSLIVTAEGWLVMARSEGGTHADLAADPTPRLTADTWSDLTISLSRGEHRVDVDGQTALTVTDPNPLGPGAIGIQALGEVTVSVDQVQLSGVAVPGTPGDQDAPTFTVAPGAEPGPQPEPVFPGQPAAPAPDTTAAPQGDGGLRGLFDDVFRIESANVDVGEFAVNLVLAGVLSYILSRVYVHWGSSLSNRRRFASNFMLVTVTTTFIILVVRSSVALSLGLVGALSIVRFRAAIKDPEELAYMFLAIGIGIGLGDNQRLITVLAMAAAIALVGILHAFRSRKESDANLHLTVASTNPGRVELPAVTAALQPHCARLRLTRYDETATATEAAYLVEFRDPDDLDAARTSLRRLSPEVAITFLDDQGLW